MKKTTDLKIYKSYWYVLDFTNFQKPTVLPIYFLSKKLAKEGIRRGVKKNLRRYYRPIQGKVIIKHEFPVVFKKGTWKKVTKYDYPTDRLTAQQKKTFRTVMRRRLRRMGILSIVRPKLKITEKPKIIKEVVNRQKVAKNKNSEAKIFQLQRKPRHIFYFLVRKRLSAASGKLFLLNVIRINLKDGSLMEIELETKRHDLIRPILLSEFKKIIYEKGLKTQETPENFIARLKEKGIEIL